MENRDVELKLSQLRVYPLKGSAPVIYDNSSEQEIHLGLEGLEHDRSWVVIDEEKGRFASQRDKEYHKLCTIQTELYAAVLRLRIGDDTLELSHSYSSDGERQFRLFTDQCHGYEHKEGSEMLSEYFGRKSILVRQSRNRLINRFDAPADAKVSFADRYPFSGVMLETYEKLLRLLQKKKIHHVDLMSLISRFRMNALFEGKGPHFENKCKRIEIGDNGVVANGVRPCERCTVPYVDQETGEVDETLKAAIEQVLSEDFLSANKKATLGENFVPTNTGDIAVGSIARVTEMHQEGFLRSYTPSAQNRRDKA